MADRTPPGGSLLEPGRHLRAALRRLLVTNRFLYMLAPWLFAWGTVAFVLRSLTRAQPPRGVGFAVAGTLPLLVLAFLRERRRLPQLAGAVALTDSAAGLGGLAMTQEEGVDVGSWPGDLPPRAVQLRWDPRRPLGLAATGLLYAVLCCWVPTVSLGDATGDRLDVDRLARVRAEQINILEEERILDRETADSYEEALERLKSESSAMDPARTWEALDRLGARLKDAAAAEAEEALARAETRAGAETLAETLAQRFPEAGGRDEQLGQAMRELARLMAEMGLAPELPDDLLQAMQTADTDPELLRELARRLKANREAVKQMIDRLCRASLVSAECRARAGECGKAGDEALAAFLAKVARNGECTGLAALVGRGGITRGRGDAVMTWTDPSSEDGAGYRDEGTASDIRGMDDAELVGVSRTAPEVNEARVATEGGALAGAEGTGAGVASEVLPRHRATVRRFFKRGE